MAVLVAILGVFVVLPIAAVLKIALTDDRGGVTLAHLARFFQNPLYVESLVNSMLAGFWTVVVGTVLALPLAFVVARYDFPGRMLVVTLSTLPLVLPPFVGAALLGVVVAAAIAYLLQRGRVPGRGALDAIAMMPIALPGVVIGVGFLRVFYNITLPGTETSLASTWAIFVLAYMVRRLPYALRASHAALHQVHGSLEDAAAIAGAPRVRAFRRVVLPLILGGVVAGGVLVFITAAVEFSTTITLVSRIEQSPLSYGIYIYSQSPLGRGAAAALGVVAIVIVGLGTYLANRLSGRGRMAFNL
jgi:iron(III) transport system permease protein